MNQSAPGGPLAVGRLRRRAASTAGRRPGRRPSRPGSDGWPTPAYRSARSRRRPPALPGSSSPSSATRTATRSGLPARAGESSFGRLRDRDPKRHVPGLADRPEHVGIAAIQALGQGRSDAAVARIERANPSLDRQAGRNSAGVLERDQDRAEPRHRGAGTVTTIGSTRLERQFDTWADSTEIVSTAERSGERPRLTLRTSTTAIGLIRQLTHGRSLLPQTLCTVIVCTAIAKRPSPARLNDPPGNRA